MAQMVPPGEYPARWWLPGRPDHKVIGRYLVDAEGQAAIELFERLERPDEAGDVLTGLPFAAPEDYPILYGEANGYAVTAYLVKYGGGSFGYEEHIRLERRTPTLVVESTVFFEPTENVIICDRIKLSPPMVGKQLHWNSVQIGPKDDTQGGIETTLSVTAIEPRVATIDDARFSLIQSADSTPPRVDLDIQVTRKLSLTVNLGGGTEILEAVERWIRPLIWLFSTMTGVATGISHFQFTSPSAFWPEDSEVGVRYPRLLWMTARIHIGGFDAEGPEPLVRLSDLDWEGGLRGWFDWAWLASSEIKSMMALLDKDYGHLESRFTTTCQLVEGVHRKAFPVVDEELKKHEKFVQKLVNTMLEQGFTSREIKRIRGLLKHAYGPNLERRIVELERHAGGILSQIDGLDVHALAGGIAKLRNSFAHSTSEEVSNNARAIQVGLAATSIIVFGFMLTRMGIDQSSVLALMYRWRRCQQWIWLVQNHWQVLIES